MNAKIKKLWVKALRSGKYKQGKTKLHYGNQNGSKYCCLGVLSDLAVKNGVCSRKKAFERNETLNIPVCVWAGLDCDRNPVVNGNRISIFNDKKNFNFRQIADLIEKNL